MSDFGLADDSVAICKGVMLGVAPGVRVIDLTHQIKPYSVEDAARFLAGTTRYYPAGTVFLAVVDPGVGGSRRPMVAASKRGQYFVVPDNGLITLVAQQDGLAAAREIAKRQWMAETGLSSTFHGRDVFSPVAAHLARGEDWTDVGPPIAAPVMLKLQVARANQKGVTGEVIALDGPYGNLITNVDGADFWGLGYRTGDTVPVRIGKQKFRLPFVKTFGDVPLGRGLLYVDSRGRVAVALNQGNFAKRFSITPPVALVIPRR